MENQTKGKRERGREREREDNTQMIQEKTDTTKGMKVGLEIRVGVRVGSVKKRSSDLVGRCGCRACGSHDGHCLNVPHQKLPVFKVCVN